ncbi:DegT/DnrJ/EryC1/StrS family aminotransferase [Serratia proteamaculans]|uniref:DegT/DnrJ/EryC1/StrS family aminotransferase n=1 Tax=Serratia TaxID=613 RepID=UPI0015772C28|nr:MULTISPECIES: DegT/DnrJ/EryC1/StrS family aminotransferase [Serratia]NTX81340.1 DegT/DnrJ/EryC1/StrS family aminotransferase [Serratia proteamaculans]NTZ30542.1 DegT/DnrJ/EryC1/StrS family aminotransferase [Serratia proteamaculans]CAI0711955.1 UDP-4-amino-4-deoxy-L-arabinose--oxoglutarate aminotransferase [Serratia quinivorans]
MDVLAQLVPEKHQQVFPAGLPFLKPFLPDFSEIEESLKSVMTSGMLTKGKLNTLYESNVSEFISTENVIAVSSATTGLILTLLAMEITGEVLVPAFTFCATANAIVRAGAKPVFVDCLPDTYTICPKDLESKITSETQAIMAVHVFGIPAECEKLQEIAGKHNLKLIYDSAHAMGSELNGIKIGGFGDVEVFSTTPTKTLVTGEGGLISTNNAALADRIRILKEYGNGGDYDNAFAGLNGRLSEMQCALGIASLNHLSESIHLRTSLAETYKAIISDIPGISLQTVPTNVKTTYKDLSIVIDAKRFGCDRDRLAQALLQMGIPTRKYFYPALHEMRAFREYSHTTLPITESIARSILCLPLYPDLSKNDAEKVARAIRAIQELHS